MRVRNKQGYILKIWLLCVSCYCNSYCVRPVTATVIVSSYCYSYCVCPVTATVIVYVLLLL